MKNKIISLVLVLCILLISLPMDATAAGNFGYKISSTTTTPSVGSEFEVTISLTNYSEIEDEIRGLQIDITNIDSTVFEVISHTTMIEDPSAGSNVTSNSIEAGYVRLLYFKFSGVMDKSATDLMKFKLKVKSDLIGSGFITLPITFKIETLAKEKITLTDSLIINYQQEVVRVDVSWGSMEFIYDDGIWDDKKHIWVNGTWTPLDENGNLVTVKNAGSKAVNVVFTYTPLDSYENIKATFVDDSDVEITNSILLEVDGLEQRYWLKLCGITESRWTDSFVTIGSVTVTITE